MGKEWECGEKVYLALYTLAICEKKSDNFLVRLEADCTSKEHVAISWTTDGSGGNSSTFMVGLRGLADYNLDEGL